MPVLTQNMWTFVLMLIASFVPVILVGRSPTALMWQRYLIALVAAVPAGLLVASLAPVYLSPHSFPPYALLGDNHTIPALVLAAAFGTFLYSLGNVLFVMMSEARPPQQTRAPKTPSAK